MALGIKTMRILELTLDRYDEVLSLMRSTPGVTVRDADSKPAMARYLERNPGLSFIVEVEGRSSVVRCAVMTEEGGISSMYSWCQNTGSAELRTRLLRDVSMNWRKLES